jgi:hypothetical protein
MRAIEARARKTHAWAVRLIERDLLDRLDAPTGIQRALIKDIAAFAARVRWDDATGNVTADTWKAGELVAEGLTVLGLDKQMTVAAASLRHAKKGQG